MKWSIKLLIDKCIQMIRTFQKVTFLKLVLWNLIIWNPCSFRFQSRFHHQIFHSKWVITLIDILFTTHLKKVLIMRSSLIDFDSFNWFNFVEQNFTHFSQYNWVSNVNGSFEFRKFSYHLIQTIFYMMLHVTLHQSFLFSTSSRLIFETK